MLGPDMVRTFARYNAWQNRSLYAAADGIGEEARRLDRGAFFGSIHRTLNHVLWADEIWLHRLAGTPDPGVRIGGSAELVSDWETLKTRRAGFDAVIDDWAAGIGESWLAAPFAWYSGSARRDMSKPAWMVVAHVFNHQTHHRGQVHAMLTAAGARPEDTDLFLVTDSATGPA